MAVSPLGWMFVGYSVIWAAITLYVVNLGRRQATMEREVATLRAALDAEAGAAETGGASAAEPSATQVPQWPTH